MIVIDELFEKTKPQCIGHYIIDIPANWKNGSSNSIFIDDFRIKSEFIYPPAFKQRIELREKELIKMTKSAKDTSELKDMILLADGKGIIFDRNRIGIDDAYRTLEAHVYVNNVAFIITADILDLSAPKYESEKKLYIEKANFSESSTNTRPTTLAAMQSLISRLSGRENSKIPIEKGLCIPNGFIKDDGGKHKEDIGFSYNTPDFIIGLHTDNTVIGSKDTLFNRSAAVYSSLIYTYFNSLGKKKSFIHDIPTEMWLFGGIQDYNSVKMKVYNFDFYANEAIASPQKPWLKIVLNSEYRQTRFTEAQMIEIWDRIVNSLRYRPTAL